MTETGAAASQDWTTSASIHHFSTELLRIGDQRLRAGRYEDAARAYRLALRADPGNRRASAGHNRAIRRCVPRWHFEMLHDEQRAASYDLAITRLVTPGCLVLDIGTGSGLLAMMAARAGAPDVVACEAQPFVAEAAERIIAAAGFGDVITVHHRLSTELRVPRDLPRRADLLVTETVDCGLLGEGILPTIAHAREHLLTPDARIVPGRARVLATLVESPLLFRRNSVGPLYGFDLSAFNELASLEYFDSRLASHEHRLLCEPFEVFAFDFHRDGPAPASAELVVTPTATGTCHAVVFWFELELVPGVELTNAPHAANTHWKQAVQCLPATVEVDAGRPLPLTAHHDGLCIHVEVAS
jgi:type II protein arginine methyltransferase